MKIINLEDLHPHPKNPRLAPREDVVEQIAAQINGEFDPAHALIVRPASTSGYEIISGHHRYLAAGKAGLTKVPCWVREMSDDDAYMALALCNAQGELHPLEEGLHALGSGMPILAYADKCGMNESKRRYLAMKVQAAKIRHEIGTDVPMDQWRALSELHPASPWLWNALVARLSDENWTVEIARRSAQKLKDVAEPPKWTNRQYVAYDVVHSTTLKPSDVKRFAMMVEATEASLERGGDDADRLIKSLHSMLRAKRPFLLSTVSGICNQIEEEQAELIKLRKQADFLRTKREEEIKARNARLRKNISLEEWNELKKDEQDDLLATSIDDVGPGVFNPQNNESIEWAQWSWNPVTGCLHDCPYCYARDIAVSQRMVEVYPNGFAPTFRPAALLTPRTMKIPPEAKTDTRYRNVFTCSMADLFGRWVPKEWIDAVFAEIRNAPQWNFLCLTKFPKRMSEFEIPDNAWMGTTVDLQARVASAEAAFAKVKGGIRWLSVEPMLEPLKFKNLGLFNWIVIGGASASTQTPEWRPPFEWILDLTNDAMAAGCKVYYKTNLLRRRLVEMPFDAPVPSQNVPAPDVFHYLKNKDRKAS